MISIPFEKYTLPNGLDVILHEDHSLPVTAVNVWYHVGSKDEEAGRTGFAHLFEHVMFEGSKNYNKSYFEPLQKVGAALNGSTTPDRTNYWENVPSNYLELALWLESDRMGYLLDALDQKRFDIQRDVVKNERRQSYENRPYGMASLELQPRLFPAPHPYSWPTIGSQEDLDAAKLDDIKEFFTKYYAPSNASLAIGGDFDYGAVKTLVERYFGDLPPGPPIKRMGRMDSPLNGHVSVEIRDKVQLPRLYIAWPTKPMFSEDEAALDFLSIVLADGKSSRVTRQLVYEKQTARDVRIYHYGQEIAGEFFAQVTANPGMSLDEIEDDLFAALDRLRKEPPTEREMQRARNRIENQHIRQLERTGGFSGRTDMLNHYNVFGGDPALINTDFDRYMQVQAEDVRRVANEVLGGNYVRMTVLPEKALSVSASGIDRSAMPAAAEERGFHPPVPKRLTLPNGLKIIYMEKRELPMVAFGLLIRAGAVEDPADKPGLAQMTAEMTVEGTRSRSSQQIADEMEFLGGHLYSEASREYTLLTAETTRSTWTDAFDIVADVAIDAVFPEKELARVRSERLTDLRRIVDNPMTIATRASNALLYGAETEYGHPVTGVERSVSSITPSDLSGFYARYYGPQNTTLMVAGDVSADEILEAAQKYLGGWSGGTEAALPALNGVAAAPANTTIYLADKPGAAQSVIRAGHLTVQRSHPDYHTLNLVNYIFGGQFAARLNMNLRQDKGYSYGYNSSVNWYLNPSALFAGGSVQTEVTRESVVETLKEFAGIRGENPITEDEFRDAKDGILRNLPSNFETLSQTIQQLMRIVHYGLPDDYYTTYAERVGGITLDDARRVASELIHDDTLAVLVVGDRKVVESNLKEIGLPLVLVDYEGRAI